MKMLDGTLTETLYHWPEKASKKRPMEQFAANDYHENQVAYICGECWLPEKGYSEPSMYNMNMNISKS